jgi:aromatic-L-amino-acid decarboxylase
VDDEGWNEADSLVVNPHKMLFVPFDFSALYVRNIARLRKVFTLVPEYLRGDAAGAEINYMDYGVQLGRRFRALKAWMVWRTFGRVGIAARIRDHMRLAQLFTELDQRRSAVRARCADVMGVVCFRSSLPTNDQQSSCRKNQCRWRDVPNADETPRPACHAPRPRQPADD